MTNNTDPVQALIAKWQAAPYGKGDHDYYVDGLRACARELEAALASAPPSSGEVLGYVRREAIEALRTDDEVTGVMVHAEPPTDSVPVCLASAPVVDAWKNAVLDALAGTGMDAAPDEPPYSVLNRIIRWHEDVATDPALAQQPAAPSGEAVASDPAYRSGYEQGVADSRSHECDCVRTVAIAAPQQPAGVDGMVMVQASDLKTLAEFADRGMRGNPAKLAALRAKAILAAQQQGGA